MPRRRSHRGLRLALALATSPVLAAGPAGPSDPHPPAPIVAALQSPIPEEKPADADAIREQVRRFGNTRTARLFDASNDGSQLLIGTRFSETRQLFQVASPLGTRSQLTFGQQPIESARLLPQDPNILLYLQDPFGKQNYQIYKFDKRTSQAIRLTDGKSRHSDLLLARDGARLAWTSNARGEALSDLYVAEAVTPDLARRVTALPGLWRGVDFAPNGRTLLAIHETSAGDAELFAIPVDGSAPKKLWPQEGTASVRFASYSADGHELFFVTDKFSDAQELVRLDADHPEKPARRLTQELKWDVDALACAQDKGAPAAAAIAVNQGGYDRLYLLEPGTLKLMPVSLPPGVVTALRFPNGKSDLLDLGLTSPTLPEDVYQLEVRTRRLSRWTRSEPGPIDLSALLLPQSVSWLSDGLALPALIYRPRNESGAKLPVVIALGRAQSGVALSRPVFDPLAQLLAGEAGLAVVEPAFRGTRDLGHKRLGDSDPAKLTAEQRKDLAATLDWIAAQPDLDASRVAVIAVQPGVLKDGDPELAKRVRAALGADDLDPAENQAGAEKNLAAVLRLLREKLGKPAAP